MFWENEKGVGKPTVDSGGLEMAPLATYKPKLSDKLELWCLSIGITLFLSIPSFGQDSKVSIENVNVYRDSICISVLIKADKIRYPLQYVVNNSFVFFWGHLKPPLMVISFLGTSVRGKRYTFYPPLSCFKVQPKYEEGILENRYIGNDCQAKFELVDSTMVRQKITLLTPGRNSKLKRVLNKLRFGAPKIWVNLILDWEKDVLSVDSKKLPY